MNDPELTDAEIVNAMTAGFGFRPLDAFVALPFCEHDEAPLVVADLPRRDDHPAILRRFSTVVTAAATRDPCAHSVIVVVYSSESYGNPRSPAWHELVRAACEKMHRSGLHLSAAFCVAQDGWGEYIFRADLKDRCRRRPLSELEAYAVREL